MSPEQIEKDNILMVEILKSIGIGSENDINIYGLSDTQKLTLLMYLTRRDFREHLEACKKIQEEGACKRLQAMEKRADKIFITFSVIMTLLVAIQLILSILKVVI